MKKGEIWLVDLPEGKGHEQKGARPALVLASVNGLTIAVPLTSTFDAARFSYTEVLPARAENGLKEDSVALVFQTTALDNSRFGKHIGEITREQCDAIDELLKLLLKIGP